MPNIADLCVLFIGEKGEESIRFNRLSWWISLEGYGWLQNLSRSPEYESGRTVPYDSNGYPLRFTQESEREVRRFAEALGGSALPSLIEAEAMVAALLAGGLQGVVSHSTEKLNNKADELLRFLYMRLKLRQDDWFYLKEAQRIT